MTIPELQAETVTNLFTNPNMTGSGEVVVWENLTRGSRGEGPSLSSSNPSEEPVTRGAPVPAPHPMGIETALKQVSEGNRENLINLYNLSGRYNATTPEGVEGGGSVWVWVSHSGYRLASTLWEPYDPEIDGLNLPPEQWIELRTSELRDLSDGFGLIIRTITRLPADPTHAGYVTGQMFTEGRVPFEGEFFDELFSPDPDLTPQPRPGGGSRLVGTAVSSFAPARCVVIRSTQWSKSGGVSARLINTSGDPDTYAVTIPLFSRSNSLNAQVWRRQDGPLNYIGPESGNGRIYYQAGTGAISRSEAAPNQAGDSLLQVSVETSTGFLRLYGGQGFGESVWFDLLTVTDTPDYSGPPFSGSSTPIEYKGLTVKPTWVGDPNASRSKFTYYQPLDPWSPTADWDGIGQKVFEAGVDRGMVYIGDSVGVPWSGLASVSRSIEGEEYKSYYLDGQKFHIDAPPGDYSANIEAYTYPEELEECLGSPGIEDAQGIQAHHQGVKPFNFSYRTLIGDDVLGTSAGYKIHLVYNAYARPTNTEHSTLGDTPDASMFAWEITTIPEYVEGYRPTSYFTIDSTKVNSVVLDAIEQVLYGAHEVEPKLPPITEIISYLKENR